MASWRVKHANDNTLFEITDVVDAKLSGRRMTDGTTFAGVPMNKLLGARRGDLIIGDILRAKSKLTSPTFGDVVILDADTSKVPYIFRARRVASASDDDVELFEATYETLYGLVDASQTNEADDSDKSDSDGESDVNAADSLELILGVPAEALDVAFLRAILEAIQVVAPGAPSAQTDDLCDLRELALSHLSPLLTEAGAETLEYEEAAPGAGRTRHEMMRVTLASVERLVSHIVQIRYAANDALPALPPLQPPAVAHSLARCPACLAIAPEGSRVRDDSRPPRLERANRATCFAPVASSQDPTALVLETTPLGHYGHQPSSPGKRRALTWLRDL